MLAEKVDYVIGVDTHRDQHTLAVVAAPTGAVVAQRSVRTGMGGTRFPEFSRSERPSAHQDSYTAGISWHL